MLLLLIVALVLLLCTGVGGQLGNPLAGFLVGLTLVAAVLWIESSPY